jgi:hypothetical protein
MATLDRKKSSFTTTLRQKSLRTTFTRLVTLLVIAMVATAVAVSTVGWAKTRKKSAKGRSALTLESRSGAKRANNRQLLTRKLQGGDLDALTGSRQRPINRNPQPVESRMTKAHDFNGDLRSLPRTPPVKRERPEREQPEFLRTMRPGTHVDEQTSAPVSSAPAAAAPTPNITFAGLDFNTWGAGHPPDTNGDVGPNHYIQTVNTSIGIYNKTTGAQIAAFTFDTFMSQGNFGNLCDTDNFGDPIVLYDTFEDRWIISDFAFQLNAQDDVVNPPGAFQCFAASKTSDPVSGGWNFYSINTAGGLGDYPKMGIWPDGLYLSVNMFGYLATDPYLNPRVYALNKAQMYAGAPSVQVVSFDAPADDFTLLPSNARLQTGTPPTGTPNYLVSSENFLNALGVYKFHVDWNSISLSTFTGPDTPIAATSWPDADIATVPSQGGNALDTLSIRAMMQNQYTNIGGVESLWDTHTVRRADTSGNAAPRWYQVNVTGGTVAANIPQAHTFDPDGANTIHRFMPSVAVDRAGNMAIGYSTSSSTTKPAIKYAGRLAADPINTINQTEQLLIQGAGTQTGSCGGSCTRWGDYSAMSLDPNGCTFWFTSEYYATDGLNDLTRIGSFNLPGCTAVGAGGALQGTVTATAGGAPISGATVALGARTTTTDGSGFYSFAALPAGTYPSESASKAAFNSASVTNVVITDGGTTIRNFSLTAALSNACLTDTTQADFQTGIPTNVDLTASPGSAQLAVLEAVDAQSTTETTGFGFSNTSWFGQTFTPTVTGQATKVSLDLFCSTCTGTPPNVVISIRNAASNLPTGADLASVSIPFSNSGSGGFVTGVFSSPPTLTAGTQYAVVVRMAAAYATGTPAYVTSTSSAYAGGRHTTSTNSGTSWTGTGRDVSFKVTMKTGFNTSGNFVSSLKDANPGGAAIYPHWATLSWNTTVPANTTLRFQVAASNNQFGPFNFVGPDGTAATFYTTSPANITAFNGNRYLRYKALLTTTNTAATPSVNDVTVCYNNTSAPTAANGVVTGRLSDPNGAPLAGVVVNLSGTQNRKFITDSSGNYRFDNVETTGFYTVRPASNGLTFSPAERSFSALGSITQAGFTGTLTTDVGNQIDTAEYFVRQHYLDFLNREPDEAGFNFWSDQMLACGAEAICEEQTRVNVSAAYFQSIEFQSTGGLVDGLYRASFGRAPLYAEFMPDTAAAGRNVIVGGADWSQQLSSNKQALLADWVERSAFKAIYGDLSNAVFIDKLIANTRVSFGADRRDALVNGLNNGALTRAAALGQIAENDQFVKAKLNEVFVMMEYFGYLRRDPDPDGYQFWLQKLNRFEGNYVQAEMVKAFINSTEYRQRFGK